MLCSVWLWKEQLALIWRRRDRPCMFSDTCCKHTHTNSYRSFGTRGVVNAAVIIIHFCFWMWGLCVCMCMWNRRLRKFDTSTELIPRIMKYTVEVCTVNQRCLCPYSFCSYDFIIPAKIHTHTHKKTGKNEINSTELLIYEQKPKKIKCELTLLFDHIDGRWSVCLFFLQIRL